MLSVRRDGACPVLANNRGKFEWGLYGLYKRLQNNAKEFLSGYMREVMHFFPWVERVVKGGIPPRQHNYWILLAISFLLSLLLGYLCFTM